MIGRKRSTASRLRHRLTLQKEVKTADGAGGYARSWQDVADLWAEVGQLQYKAGIGSEKLVAGQTQSTISHKVTIRYRAGVTASMRLLFENRAFNIISIRNPEENNRVLELFVEENYG